MDVFWDKLVNRKVISKWHMPTEAYFRACTPQLSRSHVTKFSRQRSVTNSCSCSWVSNSRVSPLLSESTTLWFLKDKSLKPWFWTRYSAIVRFPLQRDPTMPMNIASLTGRNTVINTAFPTSVILFRRLERIATQDTHTSFFLFSDMEPCINR